MESKQHTFICDCYYNIFGELCVAKTLKQRATLAFLAIAVILHVVFGLILIFAQYYQVGILALLMANLIVIRFSPRYEPDLYREDTDQNED